MSDTETIEGLLDGMHRTFLTGDLAALQALTPQLEAALTTLPQDHAALARLRRKAERNAACAEAAGRGIRAAQRRLEEIRQAAAGLVTYDEKGKRLGRGAMAGVTRRF